MKDRAITKPLQERLTYELVKMDVIERAYPHTEKDALQLLAQGIEGFSDQEFKEILEQGLLRPIVIEGQPRYENRLTENLGFASETHRRRIIKKDDSSEKADDKRHAYMDRLIQGEWPRRFLVQAEVSLELIDHDVPGNTLRCWLPFPREGDQQIRSQMISASQKTYLLNPIHQLQRSVYMESPKKPGQTFSARFQYLTREVVSNVDLLKVISPRNDMSPYLMEQPPHIVFTPYLRWLAEEIVHHERNPYVKAKAIYDWLIDHIRYSFMDPYIVYEDLPTFAITEGRGDCGVMALLFITLCRIAGVPARWQSGWYAHPEQCGCHDWAVFWVEPYGWIPVDPSFGSRYVDQPRYRDFYFGNLDGFRMIANAGFMEPLSPSKQFLRNDPYDHQVGEMETEVAPVLTHQQKNKMEILSFEENEWIL